MKDTAFYNAESQIYSLKRYPQVARSFIQYFFKKRLSLTLGLLNEFVLKQAPASLLEIGCADGVVARAIWKKFPQAIQTFDALDMAPDMIAAAQKLHADTPIHFAVREHSALNGTYDCIVEIGVLNYTDLEVELEAVAKALAPRGTYICSLSGKSSLQSALKGGEDFMHLRTYKAYEEELAKQFTMVRTVPVGFFVPLLWKVPGAARLLQPLFEGLFAPVMPNRYHEKLYVLTKRSQ